MPICARSPRVWLAPIESAATFSICPTRRRRLARALKTILLKFDGLWRAPSLPDCVVPGPRTENSSGMESAAEFYPPYRTQTSSSISPVRDRCGILRNGRATRQTRRASSRRSRSASSENVRRCLTAANLRQRATRRACESSGEHKTDYNDGLVLPTGLPQRTSVRLRRSRGETFNISRRISTSQRAFTLTSAPLRLRALCICCVREAADEGITVPHWTYMSSPACLSASGSHRVQPSRSQRCARCVPSSALISMTCGSHNGAAGRDRACRRQRGILDQIACRLLEEGTMLFLDTAPLERESLPLPARSEILVIDSGTSRSLATSGYKSGARNVKGSGDAGRTYAARQIDLTSVEHLPEPLRKRARHVVTENERVRSALAAGSASTSGASCPTHRSLRDDYALSVPALDDLAQALQGDDDVFGAKLTRAGSAAHVCAL